jgi:Replication protein
MTVPARIVAPRAVQASPAPFPGRPLSLAAPAAGGGGDPLGNNANNVSSLPAVSDEGRSRADRQERRRHYRSLRYRLRQAGQEVARANSNVSKCGRVRVKAHGVEVRKRRDGSAYFAGVVRCGSVWECPVCSARVTSHRAAELRVHVAAHRATGGACYMLTLTTPHDQSDELKHLRQSVSNAWRFVCSGRKWIEWRTRIGYVGSVRSAEATVGPNGWHPHLHVLVFTAAPLSPALAAEFEAYVYARWCRKIQAFGYRQPSREHGVRLTDSHSDDYIAKLGLADEVSSGAFKNAHAGRRSPLVVLADYVARHEGRDLALWREWCAGMRGARQLTWSKGLRERYATERELSDREIVDAEESGPAEVVALIDPVMWDGMVSPRADLQARLLNAAERYGGRGVRWILALEPYPGVPF